MKKSFILISILILTLVFTGCENAIPLFRNSDTDKFKESGKVNIAMESVRSLNPTNSKDEDTYYISYLLFDSLFALDSNLTPTPVLVDSYSYDENGRALQLKLKNDIKFSDASSLDAYDVKYSIDSYMANRNKHVYSDKVETISYVNVISENELIINFSSEDNAGLDNLVFPILSSQQDQIDTKPVGSGPYKVKSYDIGKGITLIPNKSYREEIEVDNRLIFDILPNKEDALKMLGVGMVSFAVSEDINRDVVLKNPDIKIKTIISNEVDWLAFNFNSEILSNNYMRKAIATAIDRKEVIDSAYFNNGVQSDTIYFPGYLGVGSSGNQYSYDENLAKDFIKKAGFEDKNNDGYCDDKNGNRIELNIVTDEDNQSKKIAASQIKDMLKNVGIKSIITSLPHDSYIVAIKSGAFDMYIGGGKINEKYDMRQFLATKKNPLGYSNSRLDEHMDEIMRGKTISEKKDIFKKIQSILIDDLPYYCLAYKTYGAISTPSMEGDIESTFFNIYQDARTWKNLYLELEAESEGTK